MYCVCVTFVVFADCESCTRAISTNPGSMQACEYGLTCGTCFIARRLEVVAVAGLLLFSWCVLGAAGLRFLSFFFFERTRPAVSTRPPCLIYLSTSNEPHIHFLVFQGKTAFSSRAMRACRMFFFKESVQGCAGIFDKDR